MVADSIVTIIIIIIIYFLLQGIKLTTDMHSFLPRTFISLVLKMTLKDLKGASWKKVWSSPSPAALLGSVSPGAICSRITSLFVKNADSWILPQIYWVNIARDEAL